MFTEPTKGFSLKSKLSFILLKIQYREIVTATNWNITGKKNQQPKRKMDIRYEDSS